MRVLDVQQGSPEWLAARLGIPTASRFSELVTPKTRKPSSQADKYLRELLAERLLGHPVHEFTSDYMQRGIELEPRAAMSYELQRGVEAVTVGFVLTDDGRAGASPDRLIGEDGALEIKCLSATSHIAALMDPEAAAMDHFAQCQGQLYVAERSWCDLLFYNDELPSVTWRFQRDESYIAALHAARVAFCDRLDTLEEAIRDAYNLAPHEPGPAAPGIAVVRFDGTVAARGGAAGKDSCATDGATVSVVSPLSDIEKAYRNKQNPIH